jgi:DNA invertase Pin-like site-specific DNA recombinase
MSEESRLGREQIETAYALKQITDADVRVFFYLEDRERTVDNAMDKVMLSLTNFAAEMEREKARQRTYDAMLRKAKALHVTGGKVYGYDNVEILGPNGTRASVTRRINPEQAAVVRRLFELYANGLGPLKRATSRLTFALVPSVAQDGTVCRARDTGRSLNVQADSCRAPHAPAARQAISGSSSAR